MTSRDLGPYRTVSPECRKPRGRTLLGRLRSLRRRFIVSVRGRWRRRYVRCNRLVLTGHEVCGAIRLKQRVGVPLPDYVAARCPACGDDRRYIRNGVPGPYTGHSYDYYD